MPHPACWVAIPSLVSSSVALLCTYSRRPSGRQRRLLVSFVVVAGAVLFVTSLSCTCKILVPQARRNPFFCSLSVHTSRLFFPLSMCLLALGLRRRISRRVLNTRQIRGSVVRLSSPSYYVPRAHTDNCTGPLPEWDKICVVQRTGIRSRPRHIGQMGSIDPVSVSQLIRTSNQQGE